MHKLFVLAWVLGFGTQAFGATAEIKTDRGLIVVELLADKAPRSVSHFVELANAGFYNGLTIHRVIPGMLIQGGAPKDDETGGPGYCVDDEFHKDLRHSGPGIVSFSSDGPNTIGSQFVITTAKVERLDHRNSVFGRVVKGMDVVENIAASNLRGSSPQPPVTIETVLIKGRVETVELRKRRELDEKAAATVVEPGARKLLQAIAGAQELGVLKKLEMKSVKSRCDEAQLYYQASFPSFSKASLLIYGTWEDSGFSIQQFQFSRGAR